MSFSHWWVDQKNGFVTKDIVDENGDCSRHHYCHCYSDYCCDAGDGDADDDVSAVNLL